MHPDAALSSLDRHRTEEWVADLSLRARISY